MPPPRTPRRPSATVRSATRGSTLKTVAPEDEPVAMAIVRGAVTVDELVAMTHLTVAAVLGALTRLEVAGLAIARHGRYAPAGSLALASPERENTRAIVGR
jgi:predicted Rossmann fold nucleotide-binding protein DprA/Smf involved in DNA uptake